MGNAEQGPERLAEDDGDAYEAVVTVVVGGYYLCLRSWSGWAAGGRHPSLSRPHSPSTSCTDCSILSSSGVLCIARGRET